MIHVDLKVKVKLQSGCKIVQLSINPSGQLKLPMIEKGLLSFFLKIH